MKNEKLTSLLVISTNKSLHNLSFKVRFKDKEAPSNRDEDEWCCWSPQAEPSPWESLNSVILTRW